MSNKCNDVYNQTILDTRLLKSKDLVTQLPNWVRLKDSSAIFPAMAAPVVPRRSNDHLRSCLSGTRAAEGTRVPRKKLKFSSSQPKYWIYTVVRSPDVGYKCFEPTYVDGWGPYNSHRKKLPPGGIAGSGIQLNDEESECISTIKLPHSVRAVSCAVAIRKASDLRAQVLCEKKGGESQLVPVVWVDDDVFIFYPSESMDSDSYKRFKTKRAMWKNVDYLDRDAGLRRVIENWNEFIHLGPNVPRVWEKEEAAKELAGCLPALSAPLADMLRREIAYVVIEYCCSPHNSICDERHSKLPFTENGVPLMAVLVRIHTDSGMSSHDRLQFALDVVRRYDGHKMFLWGSMPCCPIGRGTTERTCHNVEKFNDTFGDFIALAKAVKDARGNVAYECPAIDHVWKQNCVRYMINEFGMEPIRFFSHETDHISKPTYKCGRPLRKATSVAYEKTRRIVADFTEMKAAFLNIQCKGLRPRSYDVGKSLFTPGKLSYTDDMVNRVHLAFMDKWENDLPMMSDYYANNGPDTRLQGGQQPVSVLTGTFRCLPKPVCPQQSDRERILTDVHALSATVALSMFEIDGTWIYDTGCGRHLVSQGTVTWCEGHVVKAKRLRFSTANGTVTSSKCLPVGMHIGEQAREVKINPYIMPGKAPSSLSAGMNARSCGTGFMWVPGPSFEPFIFTHQGDITILNVDQNVPYLCRTSDTALDNKTLLRRCGLTGMPKV